ncbi:hypothetical protein GCM10020221_01250 [Streptomyces thioluteus]|uniref:Uncharacterized protein n=1 Tax=Streptomyces thioluteus TaxID=66431 RepID=A0ABN3WA98_STRTU
MVPGSARSPAASRTATVFSPVRYVSVSARGPESSPRNENRAGPIPGALLSSQKQPALAEYSVVNSSAVSTARSITSNTGRSSGASAGASSNGAAHRARSRGAAAYSAPTSFAKFWSSWAPHSLAMDSGWNCTPQRGSVRCRSAMTVPSSAQAVASSSSGRGSAARSEW